MTGCTAERGTSFRMFFPSGGVQSIAVPAGDASQMQRAVRSIHRLAMALIETLQSDAGATL